MARNGSISLVSYIFYIAEAPPKTLMKIYYGVMVFMPVIQLLHFQIVYYPIVVLT